jgi:hypothetical protein
MSHASPQRNGLDEMNEDLLIPPERDLPPGWLERRREHLVSEITTSERANRRRKRRLALVLVPAVILLLAATGFTTYVLTREPTHLETIGCYDRQGNTAVVNADGRHPVEVCRELWREGAMGADPPKRLVACVLATGPVGVFPSSGPDTCERRGLADLPRGYLDEQKRFAELRDALVTQFATACLGAEEARAITRRELDSRGYPGWEIEVGGGGFDTEHPCASLAFDGERNAVILVAVEPPEIVCYEKPTLPSEFEVAHANGRDPVTACTRLWRNGRLGNEPPAVACLLHGSSVGVFPGSIDVCRSLGPAVAPLGNPR